MTNFLYNPDRKGKSQLIAEFVVRTGVFDEIMNDLETSAMKTPEQHYLLVGQRGSGKTTLLNRIKYAVEDSALLNNWLIPVIFTEEQYNMSELANLWESVGQILEDYHDFDNIAIEIDKHAVSANFEEKAYELLEKELAKRGKKLLLLIDNIGDFLKKLDDKEIRRLREILQTRPYLRIIAGSPFYLESLLDYQQPFFEFFKVLRLDGLSQAETVHLLRKLGEVYNEQEKINAIIEQTPERIETLRILTGGVPRTIALMFRIFIEHAHDRSINDLEKILDAVTPLYKHRMDDLPTQQQKIVDAVAKNWDPITVKELKGRVRIESKLVSAQLRQLEKDQIIEKRESNTKNHSYLLKERFFNIWFLMRYGRKHDRRRALWLVRFLEGWCTHTDIERRIKIFVDEIKNRKLSEDRMNFFADVYSSMENLTATAKFILKQSGLPQIYSRIDLSDDEITRLIDEAKSKEEFVKSLEFFSNISTLNESRKEQLIEIILALQGDLWHEAIELIKNWVSNKERTQVQFEVSILFMLVSCSLSISEFLNNDDWLLKPEAGTAIESWLRTGLTFFSSYYVIKAESTEIQFSAELHILLFCLKKMYKKSILSTAITVLEAIMLEVNVFTAVLEPIYFALLIISNKMTYSQLPAEKVELIRNIASVITKKD